MAALPSAILQRCRPGGNRGRAGAEQPACPVKCQSLIKDMHVHATDEELYLILLLLSAISDITASRRLLSHISLHHCSMG